MDVLSEEILNSFENVYISFYIRVFKFFTKRVNSKAECEDLTSEVFYSCLKNFNKYDPSKASLATWIYTVAWNKLKNYYRDKKETLSVEDASISSVLFHDTDMENAIFLTQMEKHLKVALKTVSERECIIVELRYFSGLNSDEVAKELGITAGNVRVILTRTLKKLAEYLENNGIRWE